MLYQNEMLRTLHRFAAFARSKNRNETYSYFDSHSCACAQFQKHEGTFKARWANCLPTRRDDPECNKPLALINFLAATAALALTLERGVWAKGKWGDLLKLVEAEIENLCES